MRCACTKCTQHNSNVWKNSHKIGINLHKCWAHKCVYSICVCAYGFKLWNGVEVLRDIFVPLLPLLKVMRMKYSHIYCCMWLVCSVCVLSKYTIKICVLYTVHRMVCRFVLFEIYVRCGTQHTCTVQTHTLCVFTCIYHTYSYTRIMIVFRVKIIAAIRLPWAKRKFSWNSVSTICSSGTGRQHCYNNANGNVTNDGSKCNFFFNFSTICQLYYECP